MQRVVPQHVEIPRNEDWRISYHLAFQFAREIDPFQERFELALPLFLVVRPPFRIRASIRIQVHAANVQIFVAFPVVQGCDQSPRSRFHSFEPQTARVSY